MNSRLAQKVREFAENDDVSGLTDLLSNWPEHDKEWLLYVDARIVAPSSTAEQTQRLKAIRENALKLNPQLEEQLYSRPSAEDEVAKKSTAAQQNKEPTAASSTDNFVFSDEDKARFQIIDTIEAFEDWQIDEIDVFLNSLDYLQLNEAVQHVVNQTVYGLLRSGEEASSAQKIAESSEYQAWYSSFAPESVLDNKDFGLNELLRFNTLNRDVGTIRQKDYYAYLLQRGNKNLGGFDHYLDGFSRRNKFSAKLDESKITQFESDYNIELPEQLKELYLAVNPKQDFAIPSLLELEHSLSKERKNYEHLKGLGVIYWLSFVWGNDKDDFTAEGGSLNQSQIDFLNKNYTGVGSLHVDDNTNIVLYCDSNGLFGAVWYCQDDSVVLVDYLDIMLEKTQAQFNIYQLLTAIPFVLENAFFENEEQQKFIANIRA